MFVFLLKEVSSEPDILRKELVFFFFKLFQKARTLLQRSVLSGLNKHNFSTQCLPPVSQISVEH